MSSLTDKPLARANEHLASARYAEAAGAFRAVLHIDPTALQAHFGLADALVARGQRTEAVDGLVEAAEACNGHDDHAAALTLYGKALAVDPGRLELHLDVAMAEAALGREEAAKARLENLAETYMQAGRTDEAAEMYRFLASWGEEDEGDEGDEHDEHDDAQEYDDEDDALEDPASALLASPAPPPAHPTHAMSSPSGVPRAVVSTETVMVPTILVTPDGQLMQLPIDAQAARTAGDDPDTLPPELMEAAHSQPIDLADDEPIESVEGTVVAFPPPPPELTDEAKAAGAERSRADLEAAVAAAMDNLVLLEEEDETLVMQRPVLPPRRKRVAPLARPRVNTPSDGAGAGGKVRVQRAPRPAAPPRPAGPPPKTGAARPAPGPGGAPSRSAPPTGRPGRPGAPGRPGGPPPSRGAAPGGPPPSRGAQPGGPPPSRAAAPGDLPPRTAASGGPPPHTAAGGSRPGPGPSRGPGPGPARASGPARGTASRPASPSGARPGPGPRPSSSDAVPPGAPMSKAVRPNNPLVERLRRRAGLQRENSGVAAQARPTTTGVRPTEPISVRHPTRPPDSDE